MIELLQSWPFLFGLACGMALTIAGVGLLVWLEARQEARESRQAPWAG
jgi:hypothetical protein